MFFALVENVRSLYNVGAIFRTADGAGVDQVFLTGITGRPPHKEIRKVALGAEENVPWSYFKDPLEIIRKLKSEDVRIVILENTENSEQYDLTDYSKPLCLVIGNEYHGVSPELLDEADQVIHIPMHGKKISLNVSVAFGIAAYQIKKSLNSKS
jgi:tRNA G18 (ribose-2'-O)-methylase SpoU